MDNLQKKNYTRYTQLSFIDLPLNHKGTPHPIPLLTRCLLTLNTPTLGLAICESLGVLDLTKQSTITLAEIIKIPATPFPLNFGTDGTTSTYPGGDSSLAGKL